MVNILLGTTSADTGRRGPNEKNIAPVSILNTCSIDPVRYFAKKFVESTFLLCYHPGRRAGALNSTLLWFAAQGDGGGVAETTES